nr:far upstream element-binding protein 1-like [Lytechinus pictus]
MQSNFSSHFHVSFFIFQIAAKIGGSSTLGLNSGSSSAEVSGLPPSGGLGAISGGDAASGIKRPLEDSNSEAEPATKNLAMQNENEFNTFGASLPGMPRAAPANTMTHPGEKTEEFFVPNKMVGLIIGRQGQQISALQSESACNIQIAPENGMSSDRQVTLTGTPESVKYAQSLILDIVKKTSQNEAEGNTTVEMLIPPTKVGLVIGKGGEMIKQLQDRSGVRMVMIQDGPVNTGMSKPLRMTGDPQKIEEAKRMVSEVMENAKNNESGGDFYRADSETEVVVPKHAVGMVIGRKGEMIKRIQEQTGARVQFKEDGGRDAPKRTALIKGSQESVQRAETMVREMVNNARENRMQMDGPDMGGPGPWMGDRGRGRGRGGGGPNFGNRGGGNRGGDFGGMGGPMGGGRGGGAPGGPAHEHHVPAGKCGLVIGRGGENIRAIMSQSGAHVEISHGQHPPGQKAFLISGDPEQVDYARSLIDEKVDGGPGGPGGPGGLGGPGGPGGPGGGPGGPQGPRFGGPPGGPQQPPVQGYNNQQGWNTYNQWQQQQPQQQPPQQQAPQQAPDASGYGDSNPYAAYYQQYYHQQQQQAPTSQPASTVQTNPSTSAPQSTDAQQGQANNAAGNQDTYRQWVEYYKNQAATQGGQQPQDYSQQWMEYFQQQAMIMNQPNQGQTPTPQGQ